MASSRAFMARFIAKPALTTKRILLDGRILAGLIAVAPPALLASSWVPVAPPALLASSSGRLSHRPIANIASPYRSACTRGLSMTDYSHRTALAPALLSESVGRTLQEVLLVLVGTALLGISAKVKVPFYPVPMTLQTLVVLLVAATYGMRLGVTTMLAYLAEGILGLPVFANTPP